MDKSFLVLFFKKEQKKALLFEKRSKNFCSLVAWPGTKRDFSFAGLS